MDTGSIISDLSGFLDRLVASVYQESQLSEDDKVIMKNFIYDYSQENQPDWISTALTWSEFENVLNDTELLENNEEILGTEHIRDVDRVEYARNHLVWRFDGGSDFGLDISLAGIWLTDSLGRKARLGFLHDQEVLGDDSLAFVGIFPTDDELISKARADGYILEVDCRTVEGTKTILSDEKIIQIWQN